MNGDWGLASGDWGLGGIEDGDFTPPYCWHQGPLDLELGNTKSLLNTPNILLKGAWQE
ncbi:MAG: hypothetical protein KME57_01300 [Scytonema hyalinum WJT4-NPBG1]|nr:hypothetical protein [Scytonema hyalinum WJT4-NPBG1]